VGGEDNGDPTLSEFANDVPQCQTRLGIESRAGLVEKQNFRLVRNGAICTRCANPPESVFTNVLAFSVSLNSSISSSAFFAECPCVRPK